MSENERYIASKVLTELNYVGVDFDNTIARKVWPKPGIGEPMPGVHEGLMELAKMGYSVVIFTARPHADILPISNWLEDNNLSEHVHGIICGKPLFKLLIDDNAYRFQGDWEQDMPGIKHALGERANP